MALAAQAQVEPGASVSGYASGTFMIGCTTCPHYVLTLVGSDTAPAMADGGPGVTTANASVLLQPDRVASGVPTDYSLGGSIGMAGTAALQGALGLPVLGVSAQAVNVQSFVQSPYSGLQMVGIDTYGAYVSSALTQRYTYTGTSAATYTFNFAVTGALTDERAVLSASAGFYGNNLEVPLAWGGMDAAGGVVAPVPPVPVQVDDSFSVSLTFNPGDSHVLHTQLNAGILQMYASGTTSVDAMHTLRVTSVTGGDLAQLHAALAPVPEPAAAWLLAAGAALLTGRRLRKG
jgi:hypothetical protein